MNQHETAAEKDHRQRKQVGADTRVGQKSQRTLAQVQLRTIRLRRGRG
jgi:hypothetical protein